MDIKNLDFKNFASWPTSAKVGACVALSGVISVLGWQFLISSQIDDIALLKGKEITLRSEFETKASRAANLEPLQNQLKDMEAALTQQLRQLPTKTEMPELILDVSRVALSSGIQTELFQPGNEQIKDFYAEKPIQLRMGGSYHQFGNFVSAVASLPRVIILTSDDLSITPSVDKDGQVSGVILQGTVKTFRSLDEEETLDQEKLAEAARAAEKKAKAKAKAKKKAQEAEVATKEEV